MRRWRRDATNGKSQRVPAAANGRAVKGGLLVKAPGAGSGRGLSPTGIAMEAGPYRGIGLTATSGDDPALGIFLKETAVGTLGYPFPPLVSLSSCPRAGKREKAPQAERGRRAGPEASSRSSPTGGGRIFLLPLDGFLRPSLFIGQRALRSFMTCMVL